PGPPGTSWRISASASSACSSIASAARSRSARASAGHERAPRATAMSALVGIGYDSHRLAAGRRLVIGGVQIPAELGLDGHSDADVLAHAVTDALLGAAGL